MCRPGYFFKNIRMLYQKSFAHCILPPLDNKLSLKNATEEKKDSLTTISFNEAKKKVVENAR